MPKGSRKPRGGSRLPSLRGAIMVDEVRGSLRVRSWPQPRPGRRHPTNEYWTKWLKAATFLYRYQPARVQIRLQEITKGTPWMPRDVFISAMRGRAFQLVDQNGRKYYTMALRQDISASLDAIAQVPGEMLFRSSGLWVPVPGGNPGDTLVYVSDSEPPTWEPAAQGSYMALPIVGGQDQTELWNVNSTSYRTQDSWSVPVDMDLFDWTHFRLQISGNCNNAGRTIDVIVAPRANETNPAGGTAPHLTFDFTGGVETTDWIERTAVMTGFAGISISCKGSVNTADLRVRQATLSLARM